MLPSREQIEEREKRIEEFLARNPHVDAAQLVRFTESVNKELGIDTGEERNDDES